MPALATDYLTKVGNPGTATTLAAPGHTIAGTTFNVVSTSNWSTDTGVIFAVDQYDVGTGLRVPGTYTEWEGVVSSATSITGAVLRYGTDQNYPAGSTTRVYIPVSSSRENRLVDGILLHANQDGTLKTAAVQAALGLTNLNGYTPVGATPNTVTANGNRSYSMVFNSTDLSTFLSPGMRLRTTRTVAAPTQCTSLNGTTQYYSKTSPAGMTFTNNFVVSAWVKLSSYPAVAGMIASRFSSSGGNNGWFLQVNSSGQLNLSGFTASTVRGVNSYQSLPLNKWVHVAAQLDMVNITTTATTNYFMIDGVDIPAVMTNTGTPSALTQAGNLDIGARNSANSIENYWPGKIAQVAIYSAKVTQATIKASISQGLAGTETSLISAYSFNNSITDLNTTNANNLTANGSAVATNADSPFGGQADGTISSTLDYAIIQSVSFSTNTTVVVQVPEGCTIPTSGGVSAVVYSSNKSPYGMPTQRGKWTIMFSSRSSAMTNSSSVAGAWSAISNTDFYVPVGDWIIKAYYAGVISSSVGATTVGQIMLNDALPGGGIYDLELQAKFFSQVAVSYVINQITSTARVSLTSSTTFRLYGAATSYGGTPGAYVEVNGSPGAIFVAENSYL